MFQIMVCENVENISFLIELNDGILQRQQQRKWTWIFVWYSYCRVLCNFFSQTKKKKKNWNLCYMRAINFVWHFESQNKIRVTWWWRIFWLLVCSFKFLCKRHHILDTLSSLSIYNFLVVNNFETIF